ncbi:hypothetical protein GCM10007416_24850 [Kroppenstedtia guangzhouensis]|uniref:WD40-like Beta Propeller Repeat n=1 Tax=Kroppenstedtia guangzhouensis TaxID=1274356 RepID=A0ABQ1GVL7_9BACL|nr:hypothetical protein [Kroppenstedtia guangzhouensis]GGA50693.1 hypothetical protein GCM10007416_24850 [Kroppenstedtia guangzhouensis]
MENHGQKWGKEAPGLKGMVAFRRCRWKRCGLPVLLLLLLCGGVIWFGWVTGRDAGPPGVLFEAEFREVTPYLFQNDHLYFWGKTKSSSGYYIFDVKNNRLKKVNWTNQYGDSNAVHHLGDGIKIHIRDSKKDRKLFLERGGRMVKVSDSLPLVKEPVSLSPKGNAFVYCEKSGSKLTLHLYTVQSGRAVILKKGVEEAAVSGEEWANWSADGRYLLIGNEIYRSADAKRVYTLAGGHTGVWSRQGARLAYVVSPQKRKNNEENPEERPVLLGSRVSVFHPDHGKTETLYRAVKGSWIVGQPAWDPAGRYLAFPTGKQQDGEIFFEEVHVTDGKIFHYVESEQNLLSTRLKHLTLSPGGDYLCYAINGILKLVDLRTLESRVYDVYNQVQSDSDYVRFDPGGVWLAQNHEILFVKDNMEEREVYRTRQKVLGFHLSGKRDKLLVREESAKGQVLKLIDLRNLPNTRERDS